MLVVLRTLDYLHISWLLLQMIIYRLSLHFRELHLLTRQFVVQAWLESFIFSNKSFAELQSGNEKNAEGLWYCRS